MRNSRRYIFSAAALLWAAGIFIASATPANSLPNVSDTWMSLAHFAEYLVLAILVFLAIYKRGAAPLRRPAMIAAGIASLYGASDEIHQLFVSGRNSDVLDWATDTAGAIVGCLLAAALLRSLSKKHRR
jgi:VanZ family protein